MVSVQFLVKWAWAKYSLDISESFSFSFKGSFIPLILQCGKVMSIDSFFRSANIQLGKLSKW